MTAAISSDLLRRIPKAELHCHLDGSVRASTLLELGRAQGVRMPGATAAEIEEHMWVHDARNLEDYLARFDVTLSVLQDAASLERVTYELLADASADGVFYIEMRFSPVLNTRGGLTREGVVDAVLRGAARGEREFPITARLIICALRQLDPAVSRELAELAVAFEGNGVVGFDLAGAEAGHPAALHQKAFAIARDRGMHCTCHAGEGAGAESVREAVHICGARRVGHGTRLAEDPALTDDLAKRGVAVEICLTSNLQTRAVTSYASHPMRTYDARGIRVTLNTDNRLMSRTSLTDEFAHAATSLGYGFDDLLRIARNGFEAAFLPDSERRSLLARVDGEIAALRNGTGR